MVDGINDTLFIPASAPLTGTITIPMGTTFTNAEFSLNIRYEELSGGTAEASIILRGNFDCRVPIGGLLCAADMYAEYDSVQTATYGDTLSINRLTDISIDVNSGPIVGVTGVYRDGTDLKIDWSAGSNPLTANLIVRTSPIIVR